MEGSFLTEESKQCLDFLTQPGLQRMWPLIRKKFESYGRIAGSIRLSELSDKEREAFEGLFSINMLGQSEIRIQLRDLDDALQETRFRLSVVDSLRLLYGEDWMTRQEQRETEQRSWERFCDWATHIVGTERLKVWIEQLRSGRGLGYRTFLECYKEFSETGTSTGFEKATIALQQLPANQERLPVFAARTTGDPHGLDRLSLAGRVFYWGMLAIQDHLDSGTEEQTDLDSESENLTQSEAVRTRYAFAGIQLDDISSIVWVAGWGGLTESPVALPLWTVERLGSSSFPSVTDVIVVENPSIFGTLVDLSSKTGTPLPFPVICTSGQPSLAALKLLDKMTDEQSRIHYSGDFDVKGLAMGIGLSQRYGDRFLPWRFDAATHQMAVRSTHPEFSETETNALQRMKVPWDDRLLDVLIMTGRKVYQEQILELLLEDWVEGRFGD